MGKYILTVFLFITLCVGAQPLVTNQGAGIYIQPGGYVIVKTNSVHNANGYLENGGEFVIEGNIVNDDSLLGGVVSPSGNYKVLGDWINNATVLSNQDTVELYGNTQRIGGTKPTYFHNLFTTGPTTAIKTQEINAYVDGILNLNDVELATDKYNMVILNPNIGAILNSKVSGRYGFVSSLDTGKLIRHTNNVAAYYYPLGTPTSTGNPFYYRPIDMKPTTTAANAYGIRLAKDPSTDSYDVNDVDNVLCKVNPLYYHQISQNSGSTPADLKFYFNASTDKKWTEVAHWENSKWNYTAVANAATNSGFNTLEVKNWSDYNPFPFALASKKFVVDAGVDKNVYPYQSVVLNPTASSSNIVSYEWSPATYLDFPDIKSPTAVPTENVTYTLKVVDDFGCVISDSVRLLIQDEELLIPTAFSPNKDGVNDIFRVKNSNLSQFQLQVYNRWGEKVFETTDAEEGWDGTFRDVPQELGVYVWNAEYKLNGAPKTKFVSGNLTLVR
jgi:gliding motility-associated-like protein